MIPIVLISGFLGSGKTTLLQRLAQQHRDRHIIYLVNEFAPLDIDGRLLADEDVPVLVVPGGSIFCRCLLSDFISHMERIVADAEARDCPVDAVVIEASGVADPRVIRTLLHDSGLDDHFAVQRIVAVTDPHSLPRLWQTLPNIKAQVSAAGDVLINKTDLFPIQSVEEAERLIREANPSAALHRTIRCELTVNLFEPLATPDLEGDYARCADPNYHRIALQIDRPVHLARLCRQLEDLADGLYRAKGILPTDDGFVRLDSASGTISIEPHPADRNNRESGRFILIVNPDQRHEAESIARELAESHAIISA